ncbi:hypothetical protein KIJ05_00505 [Leuconostoc gelidum subsp. gasicomitatum]|uniref:hypothetical protein n=1 Tax=Leuconostoc gasicomitatum TaxID=115778 RepID=UPI001CC6B51E|nr:hypothetical protein [Leuconostoc gasicomitatum]MBZ5983625.1 hypothetical protein [Leuconostoc gasicomitatum]
MINITTEKLTSLRRRNGEFNKNKTDTAKYIGIERKTFQRIIDGVQITVNKKTFDKLDKWLNA